MDQDGDFSVTIPLVFTALAVILATVLIKLYSAGGKQQPEVAQEEEEEEEVEERETEPLEKEEKAKEDNNVAEDEGSKRTEREAIQVEDVGTVEELPQAKVRETETDECATKERTPSSQSSQEEEDSKEEEFDTESDKVLKISEADDADDEDFSFKYLPGKLRGSDYEKMLTKDELEEEQRYLYTQEKNVTKNKLLFCFN
ncbi:matrix-remodeling-associated protein 7 isoform X2 [Pseudophryne corroboree]|uniref:matrix-remodeling-associated protein 7 isoform X2 n=1 Tax=Pseudophryne corroboree TaxID=495146 RepID=UPI003081982A